MICVSSTEMKAPWDQDQSLLMAVSPALSTILTLHNENSTTTSNCLLDVLNVAHPKLKCWLPPGNTALHAERPRCTFPRRSSHRALCEWYPASAPVVPCIWTTSLDGVLRTCVLFFSTSVSDNSIPSKVLEAPLVLLLLSHLTFTLSGNSISSTFKIYYHHLSHSPPLPL